MLKSLLAMWETWVWSLGREDPLEKGMATHSSILPWKILRTEEPGELQSMGSQRVRHNWVTNTHTHIYYNVSSIVPEKKKTNINTLITLKTFLKIRVSNIFLFFIHLSNVYQTVTKHYYNRSSLGLKIDNYGKLTTVQRIHEESSKKPGHYSSTNFSFLMESCWDSIQYLM